MRPRPLPSFPSLLLVLLGAVPAVAQAPSEEGFTAEERITAFDLVVGFGKPGTKAPEVAPRDLGVEADGRDLPVVAVESEGGFWDVRIWIDPELTSKETIRWAADLLGPSASFWTGIGSTTVVVADPEPRIAVPATRDPERLQAGLAELALFPDGRDALRGLRHEALEAGDADTVAAAAAAEAELVRERHDALLRWLAEEPAERSRRLLVLVGEGYDEDPAAFYRSAGIAAPASAGLVGETESMARTIAAYGWTAVVVTPDPEASLRPKGVRIGKWLLSDRGIWYQAHKKPERARAFIDLGESLLGQGELVDAGEAFEKALYHFADDPKTDTDQARALAGLAETYRRRGDLRAAREALASAAELDPARGAGVASVAAELKARLRPLEELVDATAGHMVHGEKAFEAVRVDLERRVRVTVQLAGDPTGQILAVASEHRGEPLRHPGWVRSSTPERIAEARLRDLLAGGSVAGELEVAVVGGESGAVRVEAEVDGEDTAVPRVSWLVAGPDAVPRFVHRRVEPASGGLVSDELARAPDDGPWIGVLVEDLAGGGWGVAAYDAEPEAGR